MIRTRSFARGYPGAWSFNSARKFFGVPDGGYAYGAGLSDVDYPRPSEVALRAPGQPSAGAWTWPTSSTFRASSLVTAGPSAGCRSCRSACWPASTTRLLASGVSRNFAALHEAFGARNCLAPRLAPEDGDVPYCYPLLSNEPVAWSELWKRGIFAPRLWPDVPGRARTPAISRGNRCWPTACCRCRSITATVPEDMDRLTAVVTEVMALVTLRELAREDIPVVNRWRQDRDLVDGLGAPARYITEEVDHAWFEDYLRRRGVDVRCAICRRR